MRDTHEETARELRTEGAGLHVREAAEGAGPSRVIEGYAILFDTPSLPLWEDEDGEAREVIDPRAVTREFLDAQDIKFTMFHDRQLILARSRQGRGTLSYGVDAKGVSFSFEAPRTADGDKALEMVRRGDVGACSFAFATRYRDETAVAREVKMEGGKARITYRVLSMARITDFTLAADPAYPQTSAQTRELALGLRSSAKAREMKEAAKRKII